MTSKEIWTVGHSNHSIERFLLMLSQSSIELLIDVRRFPGSRTHPQFQQDSLHASLRKAEIEYRHFVELGGRRTERMTDSPNQAWRVESFNAYADYMQTDPFQTALVQLESLAEKRSTVLMCAEALPWCCHRRLIADALIVRGWTVWDIFAPGQIRSRPLTDFAQCEGNHVIYPHDNGE